MVISFLAPRTLPRYPTSWVCFCVSLTSIPIPGGYYIDRGCAKLIVSGKVVISLSFPSRFHMLLTSSKIIVKSGHEITTSRLLGWYSITVREWKPTLSSSQPSMSFNDLSVSSREPWHSFRFPKTTINKSPRAFSGPRLQISSVTLEGGL